MSVIFGYSRLRTALTVLPRVCHEWRALARAPESSPHWVVLRATESACGPVPSPIAHLRPRRLDVADNAAAAAAASGVPFLRPEWWRAPLLWRVRHLIVFPDHLGPASLAPALTATLRVLTINGRRRGPRPPDFWTSLARFGALEELTAYGLPTPPLCPLPPALDVLLPRLRKLSCSARYIPEAFADDRLARVLPALRHLELMQAAEHLVVSSVIAAAAAAAAATSLPLEILACGAHDAAALFAASGTALTHLPRLQKLTVVIRDPDTDLSYLRHCTQLTALDLNTSYCPPWWRDDLQPVRLPPSLKFLRIPASIRVERPWPTRLEELTIADDLADAKSPMDSDRSTSASVDGGGENGADYGIDLGCLRMLAVPSTSARLLTSLRRRAPFLQKLVVSRPTREGMTELARSIAELPTLVHLALPLRAGMDSAMVSEFARAAERRMTPLHLTLRHMPLRLRTKATEREESVGSLSFQWLSGDFDNNDVRLPEPPLTSPVPPAAARVSVGLFSSLLSFMAE